MTAISKLRLDDQLCFALYAATNAVTRAYRPLLDQLGVTYPQYLVLLALWQHGPQAISGIADALDLPSHAIGPVVDRLEAAGLVWRRRALPDRRVVRVGLSETGIALEAAAAEAQRAVACRTRLSAVEFDTLRKQLHQLVRQMDEDPAKPSTATPSNFATPPLPTTPANTNHEEIT